MAKDNVADGATGVVEIEIDTPWAGRGERGLQIVALVIDRHVIAEQLSALGDLRRLGLGISAGRDFRMDAIKQCGDDLSRENLLKQATSLKGQRYKMMLPGVQLNTTPQDYAPHESLRMAKFEGSSWKLMDESGKSASAN